MSTVKCQSKNPAACVDPQCPEQMFLKNAFATALAKGDFNAYVDAKEQEANLEPMRIYPAFWAKDWNKMSVYNKKDNSVFVTGVTSTETVSYDKDTSEVQKFDRYQDIENTYSESHVFLSLSSNDWDVNPHVKVHGFHINDFYVSVKLRGQKVGSHIMKTMTAHADEQGLLVELVPTSSGDGKTEKGDPDHVERSVAHQNRIIAFYSRHGFQLNPFYRYSGKTNPLTGEKYIIDEGERSRFTPAAAAELAYHSMYIRYPEGKYPKGWLTG